MTTSIIIVGGIGIFVLLVVVVFFVWRQRGKGQGKGGNNPLASILRDEKLKSGIILNAIEDGVILIDNQNIIQLFNPAAARITGWPAEEATGLDYHIVIRLIGEKDVAYAEQQDPFGQTLTTSTSKRDNHASLITRSGIRLPVDVNVSPLLDQNNKLNGAVGVFRDVSRQRDEEQRRGDFISTASHEMRTPVAAIEGYLALALNDKVSKIDNKARSYLEKAHASTQHLGKLFQDLLTSAKAEDGRLSNHPAVLEMGAYLEKLTDDLRFAAEKKGLLIEFIVGVSNTGTNSTTIDASTVTAGSKVIKPLYYVFADPERIREVVSNIFDNAVKYTETGKISIGLTGDKEVVQLYIKDTGSGIPPEDVPHLFQKFYRVDSSITRTIGGTGLGLFICSKIVELYHGRIWVESELEKGTTFFINLPRLDAQKAAEMQTSETTQTPLPTITSLAGGP